MDTQTKTYFFTSIVEVTYELKVHTDTEIHTAIHKESLKLKNLKDLQKLNSLGQLQRKDASDRLLYKGACNADI